MKIRKWLTSVLLTMVATMCFSIPAFANEAVTRDASDSKIPNQFIGYTSGVNTSIRNKDDDSWHYIYNTSGFRLWVVSRSNPDNVNRTRGSKAIVDNGEFFITNYVWESGNRACHLNITSANSGTSGFASGWWSPDSVGSYPVVN